MSSSTVVYRTRRRAALGPVISRTRRRAALGPVVSPTRRRAVFVSPTRRLSLLLRGRLPPVGSVAPVVDDAPTFQLTLFVYYYRCPSSSYRCPSVSFSLTQLPDLRRLIARTITRAGRHPVIGGGDDEYVFDFLTGHVTRFVNDLLAGTFDAPENTRPEYSVNAFLAVMVQPPVSGGPRASTTVDLDLVALLKKVTYRNKKEDDTAADQIRETSCPICLQNFGDGEEVHLTPCEHPFHLHCLSPWLQLKAECPLCRSAMSHAS